VVTREAARLASLGFADSDVKDRAVLADPSPAFGTAANNVKFLNKGMY